MKRILPFILFAAFALAACGGGARSYSATEAPAAVEGPAMGGAPAEQGFAAVPMPTAEFYDEAANAPSPGSNVDASAVERLVIQNADLSIVVSDVEGRKKAISDMAEEMGGFVVSSSTYQSYTRDSVLVPEAQVVIRVPSEKLEEALKLIKADVVEVQNETRTGQDVTAQYVDLKSRLKNLEAAEAQLDEIMKQATATEDVVNVFNQLVYYREQIELVKGQIKYYEEAAALSAISVRIIAEETIQPLEIGGWEPKGVALEAIQDLIYFYQNFVDFVIRFVIYTLPVWLTIGIPLYLIFIGARALLRRRRTNKPQEVKTQPPLDRKKKKK
jgi:hypothetical protein